MRALVLLVCFSVGCWAQTPQPCSSPSLMSGGLSVSTQSDKLIAFAKYSYDALGKRIRFSDFGGYGNKTFHLDVILLYKQGVMFKINNRDRVCVKKRLTADFLALEIPSDASLVGQVVVGSSSVPGEGILVNMWTGELHTKKERAKYMSSVTESGCIPVNILFSTDRDGWVAVSFFNNVIGIVDPQEFNPPSFCKTAQLEEDEGENLASFFNLF
ncbi:ependymin-like [Xenentodon cancila]